MIKCPGQDNRFWKLSDIYDVSCPKCGKSVEFFKDEPQLKCKGCGQTIVNPRIDLGCAKWCKYAEHCVGASAVASLNILRDRLIDETKKVFGADVKRINHALAVLDYAEKIQQTEGGDPLVVKAAAILHDIGIAKAEAKYGSSAPKYQELEGPIIAREILGKYDLDNETIEHVCQIIANHHSAKNIDTTEFRIVWDADWLVNIPDEFHITDKVKLKQIIGKTFKTCKGRQMAIELFLEK